MAWVLWYEAGIAQERCSRPLTEWLSVQVRLPAWARSQMVRQRDFNPRFVGSIPAVPVGTGLVA